MGFDACDIEVIVADADRRVRVIHELRKGRQPGAGQQRRETENGCSYWM